MEMASSSEKWYFTKSQLENSPSQQCGCDKFRDLSFRQQAANFIQDMGQRLKVSQLVINTAIVYMHRFYVFHSFTNFPWYNMSAASIFLAAKVEEQPRKLEYVIRVFNICKNPRDTNFDIASERYTTLYQELVFSENVLLQTLGFDVAIDHPHTHVVRCCHLVRASKDLAQKSYFMANYSLHLTTMCIQYKPTVVACFCILVACKWSNWEIPLSNEKKEWYKYVDPTVTAELLEHLTEEFLTVFQKCPLKLKEKILAIAENTPVNTLARPINTSARPVNTVENTPSNPPTLQVKIEENTPSNPSTLAEQNLINQQPPKVVVKQDLHQAKPTPDQKDHDPQKHRSYRPHDTNTSSNSGSSSSTQHQRERDYRERKERERMAQQHAAKHPLNSVPGKPGHSYHKPLTDKKIDHSNYKHSQFGGHPSGNESEVRDVLRDVSKDSSFGIPNIKDRQDANREIQHNRDHLHKGATHNTKDLSQKQRDCLNTAGHGIDKRVDLNRLKSKVQKSNTEHESHSRTETENVVNAMGHEKKHGYPPKPTHTYSSISVLKSIPHQDNSNNSSNLGLKPHHYNGYINDSYSASKLEDRNKTLADKQEIITSKLLRKPSLFSPIQDSPKKRSIFSPIQDSTPKPSSFSPVRKLTPQPTFLLKNSPNSIRQAMEPISKSNVNVLPSSEGKPEIERNCLSNSEKKIDEVDSYQNLIYNNTTIGANQLPKVPDVANQVEISDETNCINSIPIINGIETNTALISNLLKEAPVISHLPNVIPVEVTQNNIKEMVREGERHHHKSKKKNKDKHKHKDKDKHKEGKEKKKHRDMGKHKNKKERHSSETTTSKMVNAEPIKIKIPKDKILPVVENSAPGLKIKISKDKIKTDKVALEPSSMALPSRGGLKIKIPKNIIDNCPGEDKRNGKRERSKDSNDELSCSNSKVFKSSVIPDVKQENRRYSYPMEEQLSDGEIP